MGVEVGFEGFDTRRNGVAQWKFPDDGVGGFQSVAGDADDGGFVRAMRPWSISFFVTPAVTPPAVSAKMPSVSASSLMAATISGSEMSSAQPPDSRICLDGEGPSAGLPMASERAMVFGFCGSKR